MMEPEIGDRVGAVLSTDEWAVKLFGYGVYLGDKSCPVGPFWIPLDELPDVGGDMPSLRPHFNPCILLDNGKHVWGMECWWGAEADVKANIGERSVVIVEPTIGPPLEVDANAETNSE